MELMTSEKEEPFKVAMVKPSLKYLMSMLDHHSRIFYVRFGDGDLRLMYGKDGGRHKKPSPELTKELKEAFLIKDDRYIKAATLGYPKEPGMRTKLFIDGSVKGKMRLVYLQRLASGITDERTFWNPVVFHYLSIHGSDLLKDFINSYIKPKVKMFIGGNDKETMELLYGAIGYYIQTPRMQAYDTIDQWWPKIEKDVGKCEVVLPSAGAASKILSKRLWLSGAEIHCIDIGSLNDALEGDVTRGWIRRTGVKRLKRNLLE